MFTALNVMLIGAVIKPIITEWNLDIVLAGYLISIGFLGMVFGAVIFGRVSDIIGRRKTIIIVLIIEALFTALHGLAYNVYSLSLLRFLAGIGLGAVLPQPGIYMSEYVPARYRGRFLGIIETSWVYGALLSLIFPYIIIPSYGWRVSFIVGLIPLALIPIVLAYLPESIRYLIKRNRLDEAREIVFANGLANRNVKITFKSEDMAIKYRVKDLFSRKYIKRTILLVILWMSLAYTYYAVFIWLPTLYSKVFGMSIVKSLFWTILITLFQIPGYYSATFLLDKVGRKKVLAVYLILAGVASLFLGLIIQETWFFIWCSAISFFNLGGWAALYTYTPELYPTEVRGVGSGFAASMGRVAMTLAPTFTAYLYISTGLFGPYSVVAIIHILAGVAVLLLGIETMGRSLEELSEY